MGLHESDRMITSLITIGGVHCSSNVCTFEQRNLSEIRKFEVNCFVNLMREVHEVNG
jgi:hypothetical protein